MSDLNRRDFLAAAIGVACANCFAAQLLAAATGPVDAGPIGDYPKDGIYGALVASNQFFIVRNAGRVMAVSAFCTHKKKIVTPKGDEFVCPSHGSKFTIEGSVIKKPATTSLPHLGISLNDQKHLIVDPSTSFSEKQWDDPASFVTVE